MYSSKKTIITKNLIKDIYSVNCMIAIFKQGPAMPGSHAIERYLIEDEMRLFIRTHYLDKKDWYDMSIQH